MWNMDTAHAIKVRTPVKRIECLWTPLGIMPNSLSRFYFSVFLWADNKTHLKPLTTWLVAGFCNSLESSWRKWRSRRTKNRKLQFSIASSLSLRLPVVNLLELFHTLWVPISIRFSLFCLHVTWFIFDIHISCLINNIGDGEGKKPFCLVWFEYMYLRRVVQVHCRWGVSKCNDS